MLPPVKLSFRLRLNFLYGRDHTIDYHAGDKYIHPYRDVFASNNEVQVGRYKTQPRKHNRQQNGFLLPYIRNRPPEAKKEKGNGPNINAAENIRVNTIVFAKAYKPHFKTFP